SLRSRFAFERELKADIRWNCEENESRCRETLSRSVHVLSRAKRGCPTLSSTRSWRSWMPRKRNYLAEIKDYYASVDPNDVIEPEEIHAAIERIREAGGTAKKS